MDHKIYNEAHFKSGGRESRGAQACLEERSGTGVSAFKSSPAHAYRGYTATPRMCIDYTATLCMHIVYIGRKALG